MRTELERQQAEIAAKSAVTVSSLLRECEEARLVAEREGQFSATQLKSGLMGHFVEKREMRLDTAQQWVDNYHAARAFEPSGFSLLFARTATRQPVASSFRGERGYPNQRSSCKPANATTPMIHTAVSINPITRTATHTRS